MKKLLLMSDSKSYPFVVSLSNHEREKALFFNVRPSTGSGRTISNKIFRCVLILTFIAFALPAYAAGQVTLPKGVTLSNGIRCYMLEDRTLPVIQMRIDIPGGAVYENPGKAGVGDVMVHLLRKGGTLHHTPEEVDKMLDGMAADVSFAVADEVIEANIRVLSKEGDAALKLFFEMIFEPAFDEKRLSVAKNILVENLRRMDEVPGPIAHREFKKMIYGEKSPWASVPKISAVKKISRDDVVKYYNSMFFNPDRMIIAVAGDLEKAKLAKFLESISGPKSGDSVLVPPAVDAEDVAETKAISRKFTQVAISVGHLGSIRTNPDKYSLAILNDVFGGSGSFNSRLSSSIRVKSGLAYEIWSAYTFGPAGAPGMFHVHAKTKSESSGRVVDMIKDEINLLVEKGISREEFEKSKKGMLGRLIFEYETPFSIVSSVARFVYFGYPENYIEIYRKHIANTTLDDVNKVAKKYLHPDKLKVVVVGKR